MAREEQDADFGKQAEALRRYIDDNLRRYEERHHAAQRENAERFAQIQDDQRENKARSIRLEELLERRDRHSSRSSSRSSHRSTVRSKGPSEIGQGQHHDMPPPQANLDHHQDQDQHRQEAPRPQANIDPPLHQARPRQEIPIPNVNLDPLHLHGDNRHHRHELPPHRARRVPLADNHVDIEDDEDYVPRHHPRHRHRDRYRHHDDDDDENDRKNHFNPPKLVIPKFHEIGRAHV